MDKKQLLIHCLDMLISRAYHNFVTIDNIIANECKELAITEYTIEPTENPSVFKLWHTEDYARHQATKQLVSAKVTVRLRETEFAKDLNAAVDCPYDTPKIIDWLRQHNPRVLNKVGEKTIRDLLLTSAKLGAESYNQACTLFGYKGE
jgi:hypothetical protein